MLKIVFDGYADNPETWYDPFHIHTDLLFPMMAIPGSIAVGIVAITTE